MALLNPVVGQWLIIGDRCRQVEKIGTGRNTTWIMTDGVAYPISECRAIPEGEIGPDLLEAFIYDLSNVTTLEQLTDLTGTLSDNQKRTIWERCPAPLRQRLTELKQQQHEEVAA
jgi:hypothetical protein